MRTSSLTHDERRDLEQVVWELEKQVGDDAMSYRQGPLGTVKALLARPVAAPHVAYRVPFPDAGLLDEGEKYLLHSWLLKKEERYGLVYAYPVWLIVMARDGDVDGWCVVHGNLCPHRGHIVRAKELTVSENHPSHRCFREL